MGGRLPAKYKWYDTWMTAKEIAELEKRPSQYDQDVLLALQRKC